MYSCQTGIVIDAGANIGQYTLLAASAGQTVFAFEPIPEHVGYLGFLALRNRRK